MEKVWFLYGACAYLCYPHNEKTVIATVLPEFFLYLVSSEGTEKQMAKGKKMECEINTLLSIHATISTDRAIKLMHRISIQPVFVPAKISYKSNNFVLWMIFGKYYHTV